jgi:hypothetical protein
VGGRGEDGLTCERTVVRLQIDLGLWYGSVRGGTMAKKKPTKKSSAAGAAGKGAGEPPADLGKGMQILDPHEGRFCLTIMEPESEAVYELFQELGLQGGGYTWEGIVNVLVQRDMTDTADELDIGAEADNMYVYARDRSLLESVAALVSKVARDVKAVRTIVTDEDNEIE